MATGLSQMQTPKKLAVHYVFLEKTAKAILKSFFHIWKWEMYWYNEPYVQ